MCSFVARRTSNRQSISLHVFSNMSSVIVAKASVILAFKFVIFGTGVENTLSITYPHKMKSSWVISGERGGQNVGPSLPVQLFGNVTSKNRRTCEPQCGGTPSCWEILEINLKVMVKKYICIPRSFIAINVCNQGKTMLTLYNSMQDIL